MIRMIKNLYTGYITSYIVWKCRGVEVDKYLYMCDKDYI